MNARTLVTCSLCLGCGGALAYWVTPTQREANAGASHSAPEFVLPPGTMHDSVVTLAEELEDGAARLQNVLGLTNLLLGTLEFDPSESSEEIKLPLVVDEKPIGYLRMPPVKEDGLRQWIFEVTIDALPRHAKVAEYTDLSITCSGVGGALTSITAYSQSWVHRRASTVAALGSRPYVTGGWLLVDETSSRSCPLTLTVTVREDTHMPAWTSSSGQLVQGGESLRAADVGSVAGILFAL